MTEQEQIQQLKQRVTELEGIVRNLWMQANIHATNTGYNILPPYPICGKCNMTLYEGHVCNLICTECPSGLGQSE